MMICGNCGHDWREGDRYCRLCGAPMGNPKIVPDAPMECIYGPRPIDRRHVCARCGFTWTTLEMLDREQFCPKCGGKAPAEAVEVCENCGSPLGRGDRACRRCGAPRNAPGPAPRPVIYGPRPPRWGSGPMTEDDRDD
ncbi:MAG: hypothetical protein IKH77_09110 [Clostridia bacterium]|nr:hypothetical protein [Clostridia bacterium]